MTATHYTGFHGAVTIGTSFAVAEFSVKVDRNEATHPRSGFHSDFKVPGKVNATGTITRMMIDKVMLDHALDGDFFTIVGAVTSGADSITATIANCFVTSDEFKFTDADGIVSEPITFGIQDADTDLVITEAP